MQLIADRPVTPEEARRFSRIALAILAVLFAARLAFAGLIPLAFDEAYYWTWSKHLAGGYLDHPPAVALLIRLGVTLAGDTQFGIRLGVILAGIAATWAVWRSADVLFGDARAGPASAVLFNLTLLVGGAMFLATPDAPLLVASAFVLLCLAELAVTRRPIWWIALGAAIGCALVSKYSALFFGAGIAAWLLPSARQRAWLATPWPYLGALAALGLFAPVLAWNADHGWVSFVKQFGRARVEEWSPHYLPEFIGVQLMLITPPIALLAIAGCVRLWREREGRIGGVLAALTVPFFIYFALHALHSRVEGNWLAPVYPAVALLAAAGAYAGSWGRGWGGTVRVAGALAVPVGVALIAAVYVQAAFGVAAFGWSDPTARQLGAGWHELAREIDAVRQREQAETIVTTQYSTTAWLRFYLPSPRPAVQINDRIRWVNEPQPPPAAFTGTLLYVCQAEWDESAALKSRFDDVALVATLPRARRGVVIERYRLYRLRGSRGDPLDNPLPPAQR